MKTKNRLGKGCIAVACLLTFSVFANEQWEAMPLTTSAQLAAGIVPGGEGCQRPQMVAIDGVDGRFILYGTDVGGLFRSVNGGINFEPANVGLETCGIVGLAIDPFNSQRALAIGDGGGNQYNLYAGVYLTTNQGQTWSRKLTRWLDGIGHGRQNGRDQVAFDRASYDSVADYCQTAYWVSEDDQQDSGGAFWRSTNGGVSWSKRCEQTEYDGADDAYSLLAIHPTQGIVYIANKNGFYRSVDGGATFSQIKSGAVRSLDVISAEPNSVWISIGSTLYKSIDSGVSFSTVTTSGIANIYHLKVCPTNPSRMVAGDSGDSNKPYYSHDGGATWTVCAKDMELSWIPTSILGNSRCCSRVWHPTDPDLLWSTGPGDTATLSDDGGATLHWAGNGINNVMLGSTFSFNPHDADLVYLGFQDYNTARTTDGGETWNFINLSKDNNDGDAWGWVYGAYAASSQVMFGANTAYNSNEYELWITFDGGVTTIKKVDNLSGLKVCYGDPSDSDVLFCWNQRSTNGGVNWSTMSGCQGVFTHDASINTLYGADGASLVSSTDNGTTWQVLATLPSSITDVARDHLNDRIWVAAGDKLYRCNGPAYTAVQVGTSSSVDSVAVDPNNVSRVIVCGGPGTWRKVFNVIRMSTDGGSNWISLNNRTDLGADGGNCASWVRVHPVTGDIWVGTCCYGMWRFRDAGVSGTLFSQTEDGTVSGSTGDGGGTVGYLTDATTSLPMNVNGTADTHYCTIYLFELPNLGVQNNPFTSADLQFTLTNNGYEWRYFDIDLYGLEGRTNLVPMSADFYVGTADTTDATLLQEQILGWWGSSKPATGQKHTSDVGDAALIAYLNVQYDGGNGIGKVLPLRLNIDRNYTTDWTGGNVAMVEYTGTADDPQITYTAQSLAEDTLIAMAPLAAPISTTSTATSGGAIIILY
jgi:hypothetical protein